jgi:hypothetical protein
MKLATARTSLACALALLLAACSSSNHESSGSGGGDGGGRSTGSGNGGNDGPFGPPSKPDYAACGGRIYDKSGKFDAAEYDKQAKNWSKEAFDCRLGPKFDHFHPGDADNKRATAPLIPLIPRPNQATHLCPEFDVDTPGPATYGSTSGQVGFAPDVPNTIGLDAIQTSGWEGSGECFQPLQGGQLGGFAPDGVAASWKMAGLDVDVPVAKGRTEQGETGDGVIIFASGVVGTDGTVSSGSTHPTAKLPPHKVPTAVSVTNYNEFALVTVWDTEAHKGQVAVFILRAPQPSSHSIDLFGAPNEGGFDAIQLLGFVDLPDDFRTPTAISATGNNTQRDGHPWVDYPDPMEYAGLGSIFGDLSYDAMVMSTKLYIWESDPRMGNGLFATAGGAIVASAWEDKVAFLDLAPLYGFVRKVYIEPIQNKDNKDLYTKAAVRSGPWPFDFDSNPEMKPKVVTTAAITQPSVVRLGLSPDATKMGLQADLLGWVGAEDGTLALFDASVLVGKGSTAPIKMAASKKLDANPTSLHLTNHNDQGFWSSRGNRSVQWINVTTDIEVGATFRDSRVNDPVYVDHNQRWGNLITLGDFADKTVMSFLSNCDASNNCTYSFTGKLEFPGNVYFVDTANVN